MALKGSIFDDLTDDELGKIIEISTDVEYEKDGIVFEEHDQGKELFILKSGKVEISKTSDIGDKTVLNYVEAGAFLGELSVLDGGKRPVSAIAVEPTEAFCISKLDLDRMQMTDLPTVCKFYLAIIRDINERLREANNKLMASKQQM